MRMLSGFFATAALVFGVYLILAGNPEGSTLAVGAVVAVVTSALLAKHHPVGIGIFHPLRILAFLKYIPFFIKEMVAANLKVARVVLTPSLPIRPSLKEATTRLRTSEGRLFLSSSITLTPGTLTVDQEGGKILIHCVGNSGDGRAICSPFEKKIEGITE